MHVSHRYRLQDKGGQKGDVVGLAQCARLEAVAQVIAVHGHMHSTD
jgi:hypothetical protein